MSAPARALALLLALLLPAFAGCLQEEPAAPAAAPSPAVLVTRPDDATALTEPTGPGWHLHDYWNGEDRYTALDAQTETTYRCSGCDAMTLGFRGDTNQIVPLGTSAIEVTATWTDEGEARHGVPELWVKAADEHEPRLVGALQSGAPFTFNTTNEHADPPHQVLSRWVFEVRFPAVGDEGYYSGKVRVYAEAIRGLEIPLFPPHPDLWKGQTEIVLFEESVGPILQQEEDGSTSCWMGCLSTHVPGDGVVVPYDAAEVVVTLGYQPGLPAGLGLRAHGGDTWEMQDEEGQAAPLSTVFHVPVTAQTADSPYARQSLWEFRVWLDEPTPTRAFAGGYTIQAVAVKA